MADIVIFGAGHAAAVAKVYIEGCGQHRIVGFTVDPEYATADRFSDLPFLHTMSVMALEAVGLTGIARQIEQWGLFQDLDRLNLDGLLALWHPPIAN